MDRITKDIWIGNFNDARDIKALQANKIQSALCLDGCLAETKAEKLGVKWVGVVQLIDGRGNRPEVFLRAVNFYSR